MITRKRRRRRNKTKKNNNKIVKIIGAPMVLGQPLLGVNKGPSFLRKKKLISKLKKLNWRVNDTGDLKFPKSKKKDPIMKKIYGIANNSYPVGKGNYKLYKKAYNYHKDDVFTLVLGGDHSVAIGSIAAALKANPNIGIIWIDAHADINTPNTSPSGNIHGMPLAFLMHLIKPSLVPGFKWLEKIPKLRPEQISFISLRDVDPGEIKTIKKLGIQAFSMYHIDLYGISGVMDKIFKHQGNRKLHMSYDIDAVDPLKAPATGTTAPNGLTVREAHYIAKAVNNTGNLKSMDIVEINPKLNGANMTGNIGIELILSAMGKSIL